MLSQRSTNYIQCLSYLPSFTDGLVFICSEDDESFQEIKEYLIAEGKSCLIKDANLYLKLGTSLELWTTEREERFILENAYLEATKQLLLLAGKTVQENTYPKLEDTDFIEIQLLALTNNVVQATALLNTIQYTFSQLRYRLKVSWEDIKYRSAT